MKSPKPLLLAAAFAALAAGSVRAQTDDTALSAALDGARAAVAASPAKPISSCADAKELETPFEVKITPADGSKPREVGFEYAGCEEVGRNDYQPAYTERSYKGADGYGLTIVTNDGESSSEVLVSQGRDWVSRFGTVENEALVSGNPQTGGVVGLNGGAKGDAEIRDAAKPIYPQLAACESASWSGPNGAPRRDASGKPETGYGSNGPSLVLLTKTAAYYYHQDCDICAEVTKCELSTGRMSSVAVAHSAGCDDVKPFAKDAVYDACAGN